MIPLDGLPRFWLASCQLANSTRRPGGAAASTNIVAAPTSPPTAKPCSRRATIRRIGAKAPIEGAAWSRGDHRAADRHQADRQGHRRLSPGAVAIGADQRAAGRPGDEADAERRSRRKIAVEAVARRIEGRADQVEKRCVDREVEELETVAEHGGEDAFRADRTRGCRWNGDLHWAILLVPGLEMARSRTRRSALGRRFGEFAGAAGGRFERRERHFAYKAVRRKANLRLSAARGEGAGRDLRDRGEGEGDGVGSRAKLESCPIPRCWPQKKGNVSAVIWRDGRVGRRGRVLLRREPRMD